MILERALWMFMRTSSGMRMSLVLSPSRTRSFRDLPKIYVSHMPEASPSKPLSRYCRSSSDCFSVPTMGLTSV